MPTGGVTNASNSTGQDPGLEADLQNYLDVAWILLCAFLIVSMQAGFAMLEVGSCREAHRMTVLAKNVLDSSISCLSFWVHCSVQEPSLVCNSHGQFEYHLLLFNWSFCATAVTICSGAMAERTHLVAYMWYAVLMASLVYPVVAEGAWGSRPSLLHGQFHYRHHTGYAYHDFAGSGVVHFTGGFTALLGNSLLGRRIMKPKDHVNPSRRLRQVGTPHQSQEQDVSDLECAEVKLRPAGGWPRRFDNRDRDVLEFKPCNYLQVMGMFILWVGWYGFNAGSTLSLDQSGSTTAGIVAWNTTLAASAGGVGSYIYCYCFQKHLDVAFICNGVLAGLVSITASCDLASQNSAFIIGLSAGMVIYPLSTLVLPVLRLDDPVDAVPVHCMCGFFGCLVVAVVQPPCEFFTVMGSGSLEQTRFCHADFSFGKQIVAQVWGCLTIAVWATVISLPLFSIFTLSECLRAVEVNYLANADALVCEMATAAPSSEVSKQWQRLARQSFSVKSVLIHHGWDILDFKEGMPSDIWQLRSELQKVREERYETALEVESLRLCRCAAYALGHCSLLRKLAILRFRISPAAELSGLGAADADGGRLVATFRKALHSPLKEYLKSAEANKMALEREVRELTVLVNSRDTLLQSLARRRMWQRQLTGIAEMPSESSSVPPDTIGRQSAEEARRDNQPAASSPGSGSGGAGGGGGGGGSSAATPVGNQAPTAGQQNMPRLPQRPAIPPLGRQWNFEAFRHVDTAPAAVFQPLRSPLSAMRSGSASASTVSDRSMGAITPHSALEDTPPPTVMMGVGTRQSASSEPEQPVPPADTRVLDEVAMRLAQVLATQPHVLRALQEAVTPPSLTSQSGAASEGTSDLTA